MNSVRGCPYPLAGRSLRASCPSLTRMQAAVRNPTALVCIRRLKDTGSPSLIAEVMPEPAPAGSKIAKLLQGVFGEERDFYQPLHHFGGGFVGEVAEHHLLGIELPDVAAMAGRRGAAGEEIAVGRVDDDLVGSSVVSLPPGLAVLGLEAIGRESPPAISFSLRRLDEFYLDPVGRLDQKLP